MVAAFPSRQLPVELIFLVLDYLDVSQVIKASHICRIWRAVARDHPTFWQIIRLAASSTSALDFFQARLDQTVSKAIYIDVLLPDSVDHGRVRSVVLPAIARNMSRLIQLGLDVHHAVSTYVMDTLVTQAPLLEELAVGFFHCPDDERYPTLPLELLAGNAPRLRKVAIRDALIPLEPLLPLSNVEEVTYTIGRPVLFPSSIFEHSPALRVLHLFGQSCLGIDWGSEKTSRLSAPRLDKLEVHLAYQTYEPLFDALPNLSTIPTIVCRQVEPHLTHALLGHLDGALEMDVLANDKKYVRVGYFAPSSERARTFFHNQEHILRDWPRDVFFDPRYTQRVQTIFINTQLEWLVPFLEPLPACHTLHLVLDDLGGTPPDDDHSALRDGLLPALKTVVVGSATLKSVSATRVQGIVARIAGARTGRLGLQTVDGVQLTGDVSILDRAFERT